MGGGGWAGVLLGVKDSSAHDAESGSDPHTATVFHDNMSK